MASAPRERGGGRGAAAGGRGGAGRGGARRTGGLAEGLDEWLAQRDASTEWMDIWGPGSARSGSSSSSADKQDHVAVAAARLRDLVCRSMPTASVPEKTLSASLVSFRGTETKGRESKETKGQETQIAEVTEPAGQQPQGLYAPFVQSVRPTLAQWLAGPSTAVPQEARILDIQPPIPGYTASGAVVGEESAKTPSAAAFPEDKASHKGPGDVASARTAAKPDQAETKAKGTWTHFSSLLAPRCPASRALGPGLYDVTVVPGLAIPLWKLRHNLEDQQRHLPGSARPGVRSTIKAARLVVVAVLINNAQVRLFWRPTDDDSGATAVKQEDPSAEGTEPRTRGSATTTLDCLETVTRSALYADRSRWPAGQKPLDAVLHAATLAAPTASFLAPAVTPSLIPSLASAEKKSTPVSGHPAFGKEHGGDRPGAEAFLGQASAKPATGDAMFHAAFAQIRKEARAAQLAAIAGAAGASSVSSGSRTASAAAAAAASSSSVAGWATRSKGASSVSSGSCYTADDEGTLVFDGRDSAGWIAELLDLLAGARTVYTWDADQLFALLRAETAYDEMWIAMQLKTRSVMHSVTGAATLNCVALNRRIWMTLPVFWTQNGLEGPEPQEPFLSRYRGDALGAETAMLHYLASVARVCRLCWEAPVRVTAKLRGSALSASRALTVQARADAEDAEIQKSIAEHLSERTELAIRMASATDQEYAAARSALRAKARSRQASVPEVTLTVCVAWHGQ